MRIAVFNQKGGVGKTTTTFNLAAAFARQPDASPVLPLLFDMDPQAHLTHISGAHPDRPEESLMGFFSDVAPLASLIRSWPNVGRLVPAHPQMVRADVLFGKGPRTLQQISRTLPQLPHTEDVFFDCPPHLGVLTLAALFAADMVIIPVSADYISLQGAEQCRKMLDIITPLLKRPLLRRYVLTRFDSRRRMSSEIYKQLRDAHGDEFCRTIIPESAALAESPAQRQSIFSFAPQSVGATSYAQLCDELMELINTATAWRQQPTTLATTKDKPSTMAAFVSTLAA